MEKNLTTGSVFKTIIAFALPYLLSYFLQTLYGMADLFIIGQFGQVDSITAVANGSQVMHMLTVIIVGLAMGATVIIGRAVGAQKPEEAAATIGNTTTFFMIASVFLMAALLIAVRPIVELIGTPQEAVDGTVRYLQFCFAGIPFITAYNVISAMFRGLGDTKSPMYFVAVACVLNIGLDYLFMGAFSMGPAGAALATTLAQTVSVVIALLAVRKRHLGVPLHRGDFRPRRDVLGQVLKIGIPVAVQDGCIQVAFMIIMIIANYRGLDDAAAVGIVEKMIGVIFIVPSSLLATVSALSAQNIGAGKHDRAAKTLRYAIFITCGYGLLATAFFFIFAKESVGLFTSDPVVVLMGSQYLRGYICDTAFAGVQFCFTGYFCAYGRADIGFIHNMAAIILLRVPGSYLASKHFADTLLPMGLAAPAGSILSIMICVAAYAIMKRRGRFC